MTNEHFIDLTLFAETTLPSGLVQRAWAKDLWMQAINNLYFTKFIGTSSDMPIQKIENLKKESGDTITVPLMMKLTGAGVMDNNTLEGQEEALKMYDFSVQVHNYRNAVKLAGSMEEQKTQIDLRSAAKTGLANWLQEKIDSMIFSALTNDPTSNRVIYAGGKTDMNTLGDADLFTASLIGVAKRKAQFANIRPVRVNGSNYYIMVINPYQARDLKKDQTWIDAQKSAGVRGEDNPIFSGALGMYDGVVVHEAENSPITGTGASGANVGRGLLLGAQAGVMAVAQEASWKEKLFDYDDKFGVATSTIMGVAKPVFNGQDFGTITVLTGSKAD